MSVNRVSGVLAHITSVPGPHGVGDLGPGAERLIDWLARAGQRRWQIMPLVPTGLGDSPYSSQSAFAGSPLMISLEKFADDGLLTWDEVNSHSGFPADHTVFDHARAFKIPLLERAFSRFRSGGFEQFVTELARFEAEEGYWLPAYAQFMAAKDHFGGQCWIDWEPGVAFRQSDAIAQFVVEHADRIAFHTFVQFIFRRQWNALRWRAGERGIQIIGDIPIFVAYDSADVWANRAMFRLDATGHPTVGAGVPPDDFSVTGQLWGNPLYDWQALAADGYRWWIDRFRNALALVDIIRIDHFRGFAAAWTVPATAETASEGRWERGPGSAFFNAVRHEFGGLPIVVEDLGLITPDVQALRDEIGLAGMAVLQFAFGGDADNVYLPHNHVANQIVYTGTHDNHTTVGWYRSLDERTRTHVQSYLGRGGEDIAWDLTRVALSSVAETAIVPLQDVLRLGDEARMNVPGTANGNWAWRYTDAQLEPWLADGLAAMTAMYGRTGSSRPSTSAHPFDYSAPGTSHPLYGSSNDR